MKKCQTLQIGDENKEAQPRDNKPPSIVAQIRDTLLQLLEQNRSQGSAVEGPARRI